MKHTWIVVANGTVARIFAAENNHELKELELMEHPEGRLHARDLVSDRPGRGFERANPGRHAMEPPTSPKRNEFNIFAKQICDHLNVAHNEGKFNNLYIVANPQFLGLLRQMIAPSLVSKIAGEVGKDMTQMVAGDIRKLLPLVL